MSKLLGLGAAFAVVAFAVAFLVADQLSTPATPKARPPVVQTKVSPVLAQSTVESQFVGSIASLKVPAPVHHSHPAPPVTASVTPAASDAGATESSSASQSSSPPPQTYVPTPAPVVHHTTHHSSGGSGSGVTTIK